MQPRKGGRWDNKKTGAGAPPIKTEQGWQEICHGVRETGNGVLYRLGVARMDGCSEFRIWWQIMMPLTLPAIAAVATLEFTWIFNDYLWAIILLRSDDLKPVTAGWAALQGQYVMDWTVITAGALLATIPTVIVFIFLQRYFIEGLTLGATKG